MVRVAGALKPRCRLKSDGLASLKNGNALTYHGDSVPKPLGFFAFPLTEAQTGWFCRHPVPVSPKVGAPVASQRCRILRSGSVSLPQAHEKHKILPKYFLPNRLPTRYNYLCPGYFLLAGFEVTTIGRIWGDHRGHISPKTTLGLCADYPDR